MSDRLRGADKLLSRGHVANRHAGDRGGGDARWPPASRVAAAPAGPSLGLLPCLFCKRRLITTHAPAAPPAAMTRIYGTA